MPTLTSFSIQHYRVALRIGIFALILRAAFVYLYPTSSLGGGDQAAYWSYGQSIAAGEGFQSSLEPWLADRPPLYAYFLGTIFRIFGEERLTVFIIQAVIGAIAASLFYLSAVRLLRDRQALFAGMFFAILPHFLLFTEQILVETLYISLLIGLIASLIMPNIILENAAYWFIPGVALGLLGLVRREAVLPGFLLVGLGIVLRTQIRRKRIVRTFLFLALGATAIFSPWLIRNIKCCGKGKLFVS